MKLEAKHTRPGYFNAAGKKLPSVTTIAKLIDSSEGLIWWAWDCGMKGLDYKKVRDDAASAGHVAHAMIEAAVKGRDFDLASVLDEEIRANAARSFGAFVTWRDMVRFQLLETEVQIISERYQYGGRLDCIASVLDETCIVDWKTSKDVYPSYLLQVAGYRHGWNETRHDRKILGCHLLRVKKDDAGFVHHYFPPSTLDKAFQSFVTCRDLYEQQKELSKLI